MRSGTIMRQIDDPDAGVALAAERALVEALGGGCQTPIGALASCVDADTIELVADSIVKIGFNDENVRHIPYVAAVCTSPISIRRSAPRRTVVAISTRSCSTFSVVAPAVSGSITKRGSPR